MIAIQEYQPWISNLTATIDVDYGVVLEKGLEELSSWAAEAAAAADAAANESDHVDHDDNSDGDEEDVVDRREEDLRDGDEEETDIEEFKAEAEAPMGFDFGGAY